MWTCILCFKTSPQILMIASQRFAHHCTCHTVPGSRSNFFSYFVFLSKFLPSLPKVSFQCRHPGAISRAEISLGDEPANDAGSQLEYFTLFLRGNIPILIMPKNSEVYKRNQNGFGSPIYSLLNWTLNPLKFQFPQSYCILPYASDISCVLQL